MLLNKLPTYLLAQRTGKLLPDAKEDSFGNADVIQWLMWQMGGVGPMFGQTNNFHKAAKEQIDYDYVQKFRPQI